MTDVWVWVVVQCGGLGDGPKAAYSREIDAVSDMQRRTVIPHQDPRCAVSFYVTRIAVKLA